MKRVVRIITGVLGVLMFMAGVNKFFEPAKTDLMTQIVKAELPFTQYTYALTKIGEISIGLTLLFVALFFNKLKPVLRDGIFYIANLGVIVMMLVAIYVHLHPEVPAAALPGKDSYLPIAFILIVGLSLFLKMKIRNIVGLIR